MSSVKKFKEFFGLAPFEGEEDAYYADDHRYAEPAAYDAAPAAERSYGYAAPASRAYNANIVPVTVASYKEATLIGDPFRDGDAVVFDMGDMPSDDARRIIDFAAGLCFALRGQMKKIDSRVFAMIPENADVAIYDLERAARIR